MKCRNCKRDLPDNALYCCWCGQKQIREKTDYHIAKPTKRNGYYSGRIVVDGHKVTIKADSEKEFYSKVKEIKSGKQSVKSFPTLKKCIQNYIDANSNTLSPSTLRGYKFIAKRFIGYQDIRIDEIDFQRMINDESKNKNYSAKTIRNSWGLVTPSLEYANYPVPTINLPSLAKPETQFLNHLEVKTFLKAIKDTDVELPSLLALHSLRASELYHLTRDDISNDTIHVAGARVRNEAGQWIDKQTNKNRLSARDIPVILPRLLDILPESGQLVTIPQETLRQHLKKICENNNLPVCSLHDLRRTFASLAAYLKWQEETICAVGGWKPGSPIVHDVYVKISNAAVKEDIKKMQKYLKVDTK